MIYSKIVHGKFIDRPNRFIAHVEVEGKIETVHVKKTGRCRELLLPGVEVVLEDFRQNPGKRRTLFDLIAVYKIYPEHLEKRPVLINMDSQAPNKVVFEWLKQQQKNNEPLFSVIHPEYTYGQSRVDFYLENTDHEKILMEVKGCTLEVDGQGYFPDAPTERGVKHLRELAAAQQAGYKCYLTFVIQVPGVVFVMPNNKTHPEFGQALEEAKAAGVEVLYLQCDVKDNELKVINGN